MNDFCSHVVTENVVRRIVAEEVGRVAAVLQRAAPPGTPAPGYYPATDKPQSPKQAQLQLEQLIAAKQFNTAFKQVSKANFASSHRSKHSTIAWYGLLDMIKYVMAT